MQFHFSFLFCLFWGDAVKFILAYHFSAHVANKETTEELRKMRH